MVGPYGIKSIPNVIQNCRAVLKLNHADRQTWPVLYAFISCNLYKERVIMPPEALKKFRRISIIPN
jgi:hypothetical protein